MVVDPSKPDTPVTLQLVAVAEVVAVDPSKSDTLLTLRST
jgi:hypothetical protein